MPIFELTSNSSTLPVPEPYVREPTDFIPDSEDTSAATSREVTQANISQNNDTKAQQDQRLSPLCSEHMKDNCQQLHIASNQLSW